MTKAKMLVAPNGPSGEWGHTVVTATNHSGAKIILGQFSKFASSGLLSNVTM